MQISKVGLDFIKSFESYVPYLYDDFKFVKGVRFGYNKYMGGPVSGTLTKGYGHTKDARAKVDMSINAKDWSEKEALEILKEDLGEIEEWVNTNIKVPLTQGQYDALVSFGFNCGTGNLKKLTRNLNSGDYVSTRAKFDEFVKSKGVFMKGLQRRRDGEQALWDTPPTNTSNVPSVAFPEAPVNHPAEVDTPTTPITATEKIITASGPLIPAVVAALSDWRTAAVVSGALIVGTFGYFIYRKFN